MSILRTQLATFLCAVSTLFLVSCSKDSAPGSGGSSGAAVYDTTEKGTPVTVEGGDHYVFYRPKSGDVFRYRVTLSNQTVIESQDDLLGQLPPKRQSSSTTSYYLKHSIRQMRQDSTMEVSIHIDSIVTDIQSDTTKIHLSSNNEKDRQDPLFATTAALAGQDVGVIVTRNGDIVEIYGTSNLVARYLQLVPDTARNTQTQNLIDLQAKNFIRSYVARTLTHYPPTPLAKDSSWVAGGPQNISVLTTIFPGQVEAREKVVGFEERGGKRLIVLDATSTVKPTNNVIKQDPVTATLNNYLMSTRVISTVEDETGVLVHRILTKRTDHELTATSTKLPGKTLHTKQTLTEREVTELLK